MVRRPWLRRTRLLAGAPDGVGVSRRGGRRDGVRPLGGDFVATRLRAVPRVVDFAAAVRPWLLRHGCRVTLDSRRSHAR